MDLFNKTTLACSKIITQNYSTSFSLGIKTLDKSLRYPIYGIYGYVRFADEIVDTFHDFDKATLFARFKADTYLAIKEGISLNPVLNSFQNVVRAYNIEMPLIDAFLDSMEMDLKKQQYDPSAYQAYIYGSAEVVGLMCLRVFVKGDDLLYNELKDAAKSLGAAFQKVNFLRDVQSDFEERGRTYFPGVDFVQFTDQDKTNIEADIAADFRAAKIGIDHLPKSARAGVYLAYSYYLRLFDKICQMPAQKILTGRVRVPNAQKFAILTKTYVKQKLSLL
jgi:15-cis-phytoene synthase